MPNRLLIATSNPAKLVEYRKFLAGFPVEIVGPQDVGIAEKVEESGETFEENALLKAKTYAKQANLISIADDGGFEIDELGGEPGVHSHRWLGYETDDDEELINAVIERMRGVSPEKRTARIRSVIAIATPEGKTWTFEEAIEGIVPERPSHNRVKGYPFRPVLFLPQFEKCFVDLTEEEHEQVNQKIKLVKRALPILKELFRV